MLEIALYNLLSSDTTIEGIVGEKIYPILADESVREPYIVYQVLTTSPTHTLTDSVDLVKASVQVSCWTDSYYDSLTLSQAVRDALDNYSDLENPSMGEDYFQCIHLEDEGDLFDYNKGVDKSKKFGRRLNFSVWYNRNVSLEGRTFLTYGTDGNYLVANIETVTNDYSISEDDYTILVNCSSGPITLTLPSSPVQGQVFVIKMIDSSGGICTIQGNGKMIDGSSSFLILTTLKALTIQYDENYEWAVINSTN